MKYKEPSGMDYRERRSHARGVGEGPTYGAPPWTRVPPHPIIDYIN